MKKFVVISHTHWDREWYFPLASFRLKLKDLIERLFLILERDENFIFHLDAQIVVLEDYLELCPHREALLKKYIAAGNIRVGPWYLQNDFYLTDGESTVRNLQRGMRLADGFGKCGSVGYAPDQFGHISQMPQILNDFGIRSYVFGRGFRAYERVNGERREKHLPAEFEWVGPDGSRLLAVYLRCWYNNAQHIPAEPELARLLLDINEKNFEGFNVSPYILLMNGVDHLEAQEDVREIISSLREEGYEIEQTSLDDYIEDLRAAVAGKKLPVYNGVLNKGRDCDILKGCWSSRVYLKRENVRAQDLLENKLEALYSYLSESGIALYPEDELEYLWRELMRNQPHDSICGCATDSVHRHMEDSFERIREMGEDLIGRGMKVAAAHADHPMGEGKNYSVTVFNGTERDRRAVCEAVIPFVEADNVKDFALFDEEGNDVPYEIVSRRKGVKDIFSPLNLPGVLDVEFTAIRFIAEVPPFTAKVYAAVPSEEGTHLTELMGLENEFYRLTVEKGGLLLTDKRTGKSYRDPIRLEDGADKGDSYIYRMSEEPPLVVYPSSFKREYGSLESKLIAKFEYEVPERYDFSADRRSSERVKNCFTFSLTLKKGDPVIELCYSFENRAKDHRVRLLAEGGIADGILVTDSPFDVAERPPYEHCDVTDSDTHHNSTFARLSDGRDTLVLFTEGQHEIACTQTGLALTVLRATGVINRNGETFEPTGGAQWDAPQNQCLRTVEGRVGLMYEDRSPAALFAEGKFFRTGFLVHADSFDPKKYSGGRFAVQSAELEQLYYLKDPFEGAAIRHTPFFVADPAIAVTCCKRGLKGGTVVRLVNFAEQTVEASFETDGKVFRTDMSERGETPLAEGAFRLTFGPKQVVTLRLERRASC